MQSTLSFSLILLASQSLASPLAAPQSRQDSTPSVDLGYEVHTGTENVRNSSSTLKENSNETLT